jgi:hypothetical protein
MKIKIFYLPIFLLSTLFLQAQSNNILSIEGMDFGAGIVITWETLDVPKNEQLFIIEKALTIDSDFKKVGEISSDSNKKRKQFSFEDRELGLSKAFYRIKTIEKEEGVTSYSEVIPVSKDVVNNFLIQEVEKLDKYLYRIAVFSIVDGEIKYQLATNMGEVVVQRSFEMQKGENAYVVDIESEKDGSYVASFRNGAYTITKNFTKKSEKNNNVAIKD